MFRTIIKPQKQKIQLTLPENYIGRKIEVFAFPVGTIHLDGREGKVKIFSALSISTKWYHFNRDEANER